MGAAFLTKNPALPAISSALIKAPTTLFDSSPKGFSSDLNKPLSLTEAVPTAAASTTLFPRPHAPAEGSAMALGSRGAALPPLGSGGAAATMELPSSAGLATRKRE